MVAAGWARSFWAGILSSNVRSRSRSSIDDNDELRERFAREARSAARLHHPNIVTVYDVGEDAGRPFMAMEYIEGQTLADIIRKREPLTTARKIQLAEALVDGLAFPHKAAHHSPGHQAGQSHGRRRRRLKILDFGIARLAEATGMTRVGAALGTLNYMSPEQLSDHGIDHRSDIFSVGAVCYELLGTGRRFREDSRAACCKDFFGVRPNRSRRSVPHWIPRSSKSFTGASIQTSKPGIRTWTPCAPTWHESGVA